ncbi:hypothetical protein GCM10011591_29490 [Nocardia camponoti]|uniref:Uncharacterized protein n=1 Tax=Nocardia camponoti TaxID=1616106 RepID=A0A917VAK1_9NOCA|nr:hypothetical protein GCM10011591_29490 [Nocardia camponoti]
MTRMSADGNDEWLSDAIMRAFDSVAVDVSESAQGWRAGARDLSQLEEEARRTDAP